MNILVVIKQVPDLVEELEVDASGKDLSREWLKYKINEFDDHALEEALQLKDESGGQVTVLALETADIDKPLFTAAAKGVDRLIKVTGDFAPGTASHIAAKAFANVINDLQYDLILTGVQAADDRDGQVPVLLAHYLKVPHVSVVARVTIENDKATVHKEYSSGRVAEFEVDLPAVLGIQAARETPRYAPVSRVRQAMRSASVDEIEAGDVSVTVGSYVQRMFKPVSGDGAQILAGSADEIVDKMINIIREKGIKV